MSGAEQYIGSHISLITHKGMRYDGILYNIDTNNASVTLGQVRAFGTEGRNTAQGLKEIPGSADIYAQVVFRANDIKDIHFAASAPPPTAQNLPFDDPAIISAPSPVRPPFQPQPVYYAAPGVYPPPHPSQPMQFPSRPPVNQIPPQAATAAQPSAPKQRPPPQSASVPSSVKPSVKPSGAPASTPAQAAPKPAAQQPAPSATAAAPSQVPTSEGKSAAPVPISLAVAEATVKPATAAAPAIVTQGSTEQRRPHYTGDRQRSTAKPGTGDFLSHRRNAQGTEVPSEEFDFEAANAKFGELHVSEKAADSAEEPQDQKAYVKSSFFDNISSDAKDRAEGKSRQRTGREIREEESKLNVETFGQTHLPRYHRGRGGSYQNTRRDDGNRNQYRRYHDGGYQPHRGHSRGGYHRGGSAPHYQRHDQSQHSSASAAPAST